MVIELAVKAHAEDTEARTAEGDVEVVANAREEVQVDGGAGQREREAHAVAELEQVALALDAHVPDRLCEDGLVLASHSRGYVHGASAKRKGEVFTDRSAGSAARPARVYSQASFGALSLCCIPVLTHTLTIEQPIARTLSTFTPAFIHYSHALFDSLPLLLAR
jgi:hypothetical protein